MAVVINREKLLAELVAIVQSSDDAILGKDLNGIITSWNRGAEETYGYTALEVIGKHVSILCPPELPEDIPNIMARLKRGEKIDHYETVRLTKDGRRLHVSVTISPIMNGQGKVIGASCVCRDMSSRSRAEDALLRSEKLATAGRMAAAIAHEINNPLEALMNLLFLVSTDPHLTPGLKVLVDAASDELNRVSQVTKQSLAFYRDGSSPVSVKAGDLVSQTLTLLKSKLSSRQVSCALEVSGDVEIRVRAGEIRQVLTNLIGNAVDAMPHGGKLRVKVRNARQWGDYSVQGTRITISDNGSGISKAILDDVFEPFYSTKGDAGSGLGLWVVKTLITKHQGTIDVRSTTDDGCSGTTFSVFLPADPHFEVKKQPAMCSRKKCSRRLA